MGRKKNSMPNTVVRSYVVTIQGDKHLQDVADTESSNEERVVSKSEVLRRILKSDREQR